MNKVKRCIHKPWLLRFLLHICIQQYDIIYSSCLYIEMFQILLVSEKSSHMSNQFISSLNTNQNTKSKPTK